MRVGSAAIASIAVLLAAAGCSGGAESPSIGRQVSFTPPVDPDPSTLALPKRPDGSLILLSSSAIEVGWSPPAAGPITALAQCTRWIVGCVSPDRQLDDCARSVPTCATSTPWNEAACCPAACFERYAAKRVMGTEDLEAFEAVYFDSSDSCVPGLSALLGGRP